MCVVIFCSCILYVIADCVCMVTGHCMTLNITLRLRPCVTNERRLNMSTQYVHWLLLLIMLYIELCKAFKALNLTTSSVVVLVLVILKPLVSFRVRSNFDYDFSCETTLHCGYSRRQHIFPFTYVSVGQVADLYFQRSTTNISYI